MKELRKHAEAAILVMRGEKMTTNVAEMTSYEIIDALVDDGYVLSSSADAKDVVDAIHRSARRGALLWTRQHIVSTIPRYNRVLQRCLRRLAGD